MKLPLQKEKNSRALVQWESCSPFVENSMAALIHRPRRVATYKISARWKSHIGISFWCGTSSTGTKKFTFLDAPPEGKLLCARCEANAVAAGIASSEKLTGKHVHIGGVVAIQRIAARCGASAPSVELNRIYTEEKMAYIPPIKKRQYINALSKEREGKVIAHTCSRCRKEYPIKEKGIWFERADQSDVWVWVCKDCCTARGIRCD